MTNQSKPNTTEFRLATTLPSDIVPDRQGQVDLANSPSSPNAGNAAPVGDAR